MYHVYEFLKVLNGKVSLITTLILFIFVSNIGYCKLRSHIRIIAFVLFCAYFLAYMDLIKADSGHAINIVLGCCNLIQWIAGLVLPVAMVISINNY